MASLYCILHRLTVIRTPSGYSLILITDLNIEWYLFFHHRDFFPLFLLNRLWQSLLD
jgi:hypothetical protein